MTLWRNEARHRVSIHGLYCEADEAGPAKVTDLFAQDYEGEVALTEKEWNEAEGILMEEYKDRA